MIELDLHFFHRIRVSKMLPYAYLDMPKSASSTIRATLWGLERRLNSAYADIPKTLEDLNQPPMAAERTASPWTHRNTLKPRQPDEIVLFTFVRNPYVRTLSAYLEKICQKEDPHRIEFFDRHDLDHSKNIDFVEFLRLLEKDPYQEMDGHWGLQSYMTAIEYIDFDYIGKVENISKNMQDVISLVEEKVQDHVGITSDIVDFRPHASSASQKIEKFYRNQKCEELVSNIFEHDFRYFGYSLSVDDALDPGTPIRKSVKQRGWDLITDLSIG